MTGLAGELSRAGWPGLFEETNKVKIERSKIEIEIYGRQCTLKLPTFKQTQKYSENLKALGNDKDIDASQTMKEFLVELGLPGDLFDELEVGHIVEIMDLVTKKKT
jgi:hypothetical protein